MSVFSSRPALRWLVPTAAAVVVIGGGAAAGTIAASADPTLPERSAAQLLVDLQGAKVDGMSGTVVQTADLGLPSLPGLTGAQGGGDGAGLMSLVAGSNTARVWYAGEEKARVALLSTLGETDVIRNGQDVWIWRSAQNEAAHITLPAGAGKQHKTPATLPAGIPSTPQEAADAALAAVDPSTAVTTTGAAKVAGRDAYELVLTPRDTASLVGQVRLAIDGEKHVPLGVDVYAKGADDPALRIAFQQVSFETPDAEQFTFNPPAGAKVTETGAKDVEKAAAEHEKALTEQGKPETPAGTKVVGEGWTSVLVAKLPAGDSPETGQLDTVLGSLPEVSGAWGKGHLLTSALFSALVTDDGRVLVGAVAPEKLYEAAGK